ncbi:MAG: nucleoside-diphosphate kinase [Desulfocurvibacter africanus]
MAERTLCIIKPDAVERNLTGAVLKMIQESGLKVVGMKMLQMSEQQAGGFYAVHKTRPFFEDLCRFMCSGPIVVAVLEADNAVKRYRDLMGATNPANAAEGTIRKAYAQNIERNSVHGSDSLENAAIEIAYFFSNLELVG